MSPQMIRFFYTVFVLSWIHRELRRYGLWNNCQNILFESFILYKRKEKRKSWSLCLKQSTWGHEVCFYINACVNNLVWSSLYNASFWLNANLFCVIPGVEELAFSFWIFVEYGFLLPKKNDSLYTFKVA